MAKRRNLKKEKAERNKAYARQFSRLFFKIILILLLNFFFLLTKLYQFC